MLIIQNQYGGDVDTIHNLEHVLPRVAIGGPLMGKVFSFIRDQVKKG